MEKYLIPWYRARCHLQISLEACFKNEDIQHMYTFYITYNKFESLQRLYSISIVLYIVYRWHDFVAHPPRDHGSRFTRQSNILDDDAQYPTIGQEESQRRYP